MVLKYHVKELNTTFRTVRRPFTYLILTITLMFICSDRPAGYASVIGGGILGTEQSGDCVTRQAASYFVVTRVYDWYYALSAWWYQNGGTRHWFHRCWWLLGAGRIQLLHKTWRSAAATDGGYISCIVMVRRFYYVMSWKYQFVRETWNVAALANNYCDDVLIITYLYVCEWFFLLNRCFQSLEIISYTYIYLIIYFLNLKH